MSRIEPFTPGDVQEVADLFVKTFRDRAGPASPELRDYLYRLHFDNPNYDADRGCLVHRDRDGRITGFMGGHPFEMRHAQRTIRAVAAGSFMVDAGAGDPFAAVRLIRSFLERSHDLVVSDSANETSRRIWKRLGVATDPLLSMAWARPLRPLVFSYAFLKGRQSAMNPALAAALRFPDLAMASHQRRQLESRLDGLTPEPLDAGVIAETAPCLWADRALVPHHDVEYLDWMLEALDTKSRYGPLRRAALRAPKGELVGWYLYYPNAGRIGQVVQVAARPDRYADVLAHLFHDALAQGSGGLVGKVDPMRTQDLTEAHCVLFQRSTWTVTHSKDPEVQRALLSHDLALSRMEGDWWTRLPGTELPA